MPRPPPRVLFAEHEFLSPPIGKQVRLLQGEMRGIFVEIHLGLNLRAQITAVKAAGQVQRDIAPSPDFNPIPVLLGKETFPVTVKVLHLCCVYRREVGKVLTCKLFFELLLQTADGGCDARGTGHAGVINRLPGQSCTFHT